MRGGAAGSGGGTGRQETHERRERARRKRRERGRTSNTTFCIGVLSFARITPTDCSRRNNEARLAGGTWLLLRVGVSGHTCAGEMIVMFLKRMSA